METYFTLRPKGNRIAPWNSGRYTFEIRWFDLWFDLKNACQREKGLPTFPICVLHSIRIEDMKIPNPMLFNVEKTYVMKREQRSFQATGQFQQIRCVQFSIISFANLHIKLRLKKMLKQEHAIFQASPDRWIDISIDYFYILFFFICWSTFLDFQIAMDFLYSQILYLFIYLCYKYIFVGVSWIRAKIYCCEQKKKNTYRAWER